MVDILIPRSCCFKSVEKRFLEVKALHMEVAEKNLAILWGTGEKEHCRPNAAQLHHPMLGEVPKMSAFPAVTGLGGVQLWGVWATSVYSKPHIQLV